MLAQLQASGVIWEDFYGPIDEDVELEIGWPTAEEAAFACEMEVIQTALQDSPGLDIDCNCVAFSH